MLLTVLSLNHITMMSNSESRSGLDNLVNIDFKQSAAIFLHSGTSSLTSRAPNVIKNVPEYSFSTS